MKNRIVWIVVILIIIGAGVWFVVRRPTEVIATDTTINGDLTVEQGKRLVVQNGARLTIEKDLIVNGEMVCEQGPLQITVKGDVSINRKVECKNASTEADGGASSAGIFMVVNGSLQLAQDAEIVSDGDIQFVEGPELLATTSEDVKRRYDEAGTDSGEGQRIGPFVSEGEPQVQVLRNKVSSAETPYTPPADGRFALVRMAQAASHTVVIGGKINVATPPPGVRRIVVFHFPTAVGLEIKDFELTGPKGRDGKDDKGKGCNARGGDSEDAFRLLVMAPNITVNNLTLNLGDGGDGGDAETTKECKPGVAQGGKGGSSGNFKMIAGEKFEIVGAFNINPGRGGSGGGALAFGKDGGPSEDGGDARATGGRGADNKKELKIAGTIAGTTNVQIGDIIGGPGGAASAQPGTGGNGMGCKARGGHGGNGTAIGGPGGDASLTLTGGAGRAPLANDIGGTGGTVDSFGATGGNGGDCDAKGPGGNGGNGGNASSKEGEGGVGKNGPASSGVVLDETGGDGGKGGDGCPEGKGGKGGVGDPPGKDGKDGKNLCLPPPKDQTGVIPSQKPESSTASQPEPPPVTQPQPPATPEPKEQIQVIQYQGKYIPVSQLHREPGHEDDPRRSCPEEHWHSFEGVVKATEGTFIPEPSDPCGFGYTSQHPVMTVELPS